MSSEPVNLLSLLIILTSHSDSPYLLGYKINNGNFLMMLTAQLKACHHTFPLCSHLSINLNDKPVNVIQPIMMKNGGKASGHILKKGGRLIEL